MSTDGSYTFGYDTGPGVHQSFREEYRNKGGTISGSYGYVDPEGTLRITQYVADSKGYRASLQVFEPVNKPPPGEPLVVGPIPPHLAATSERLVKSKIESVFHKFKIPIEPFESLRIFQAPVTGSSDISTLKNIPEGARNPNPVMKTDLETENTENVLTGNQNDFPVVDISILQNQLKSAMKQFQEDPLLLIGPVPRDFQTLQNVLRDNEVTQRDTHTLKDGIRNHRSPRKDFPPNAQQAPSTTKRDPNFNLGSTRNSSSHHGDLSNKRLISSSPDLNYFEEELVSKGENIDPILIIPSSSLLQGRFIDNEESNNVLNKPKIKFKKQSLAKKKSIPKLSVTSKMSADGKMTLPEASIKGANYKNQDCNVLLMKTQNISKEILNLSTKLKSVSTNSKI